MEQIKKKVKEVHLCYVDKKNKELDYIRLSEVSSIS